MPCPGPFTEGPGKVVLWLLGLGLIVGWAASGDPYFPRVA